MEKILKSNLSEPPQSKKWGFWSDIRLIERMASVTQKGRCNLSLLTLPDKGRTECRIVTAPLTAPIFDLGHHMAILENAPDLPRSYEKT